MADNVEEMMSRLSVVREQLEAYERTKMKLEGERESHKKRLDEVRQACKAKFGCEVEDLPEKAEAFEAKAEESIAKAEKILGIA